MSNMISAGRHKRSTHITEHEYSYSSYPRAISPFQVSDNVNPATRHSILSLKNEQM